MDVWVDVAQGDDSNSGGTPQSALLSVREAVRRAYETPRPRAYTECPAGGGIYATAVVLHVIDDQGTRVERLKLWDPVGCKHGCINPEKLNYNVRARTDALNLDAVAACIDQRTGCMQPGMKNYNEDANVDGFCEPHMFGCTDPDADNYDPNAEIEDGSCVTRPIDIFRCPVTLEADSLPTVVVEVYNMSRTCVVDNATAIQCGAIEDETPCDEQDSCTYNEFADYCGISSTAGHCSSLNPGRQCAESDGCAVAVEGSSVILECARECLRRSNNSYTACGAKPLRIDSVNTERNQITLATVDTSIAAGACVPIDSENCFHQALCSDRDADTCGTASEVCTFTAPSMFRFVDAPGAQCELNDQELLSVVDVHHCTRTGESDLDCSSVEGTDCPDGCNVTVVTFPSIPVGAELTWSADSCALTAVATEELCSATSIRSRNATEDQASCEGTGNGRQCVYRSTHCAWFIAGSTECFLPYVAGESQQLSSFQPAGQAFRKFDVSEWWAVAGLSNDAPDRGERCAFGCTDPRATPASYVADAHVDDGTCEYPPLPESWRSGCMNVTAMNYDRSATLPCDECCVLETLGCMTTTSPSFDPEANTVCASTTGDPEQICELNASGCPDGCHQSVCVALRLGCPRVNQSFEFALETLSFADVVLDPPPELGEDVDCADSDDYLSMFACAQAGIDDAWEEFPDWDETMTEPNECAQRCINALVDEAQPQHCVSFSFAKLNQGTNQSRGHCLMHTIDVLDEPAAPWWNFTEVSGKQSQAARALSGSMVLDATPRIFDGATYEYQHYDRVIHEGDSCRYYIYDGGGCPVGSVHGSTGHDAAGVMAAPSSCIGAPGSATEARPYSVLAEEFRCGVNGALEQRNLMVGTELWSSDHWPGVQTPSQCARICVDTNDCVSFDHSVETGRCYLGDGVAGVHAVLWTPPVGNYRYYERIPRGNPEMNQDTGIGCRYGCTDWRAENHDARAVQSSIAVGDANSCRYRAEPALAAFHEREQDRALIPEDGHFLAQYRAAECEELCAARCLAAGPACMAINYAAALGQCYLLPRVVLSADELTTVRKYVYRPRRMLTLPRPWGVPLPGLRTVNSLAEHVWPTTNRTAVLGSLLRFDLPDRSAADTVGEVDEGITSATDIWRRMSNASLEDVGCELDEYSTAQVLAPAAWHLDADTSAATAMVHFPWRGAPQKVERAVAWGGSAGVGPRSAIVALDAVGMAHFVPRSKSLCYLGLRVTINVTGGDMTATPPNCDAAGGAEQGR
eukprot:COSAG02_NODE_27_length_51735_cov_86.076749_2_plen_1261_part_00